MIEIATDVPLLRRFVDDVDRTTPRPMPVRPALSAYPPEDREAARLAWAVRITDEYRSVAVFSELLGLLADLEAPYATLCTVQRLIGDELRHTRAMSDVVDWLGGRDDLAIDLSAMALPPRDTESAATRAVRIVGRELVVAEEESIAVLAAYRNASTEPAIRAVFQLVLTDEVRHAAAGRAILAELARCPRTANAFDGLADEMVADRAVLRATYRDLAMGGPGRALGGSILLADLEGWAS